MGWLRFSLVRMVAMALCFVASAAVCGLAAYQASLFIDQMFDKPYLIYALVVSVISIFASAFLAFMYSFNTHIGCIAILTILWLALAAYTTDRIGYVQCESLYGQRKNIDHGGTYDSVAYCRELKAIMGFAWFNFALLIICIVSWIRLQEFEEQEGLGHTSESGSVRREVRREETAQYQEGVRGVNGPFIGGPGGLNGGYPIQNGYTGGGLVNGVTGGVYPGQTGQTVVYQQPGHNVVMQNGQIRQVPVGQPLY